MHGGHHCFLGSDSLTTPAEVGCCGTVNFNEKPGDVIGWTDDDGCGGAGIDTAAFPSAEPGTMGGRTGEGSTAKCTLPPPNPSSGTGLVPFMPIFFCDASVSTPDALCLILIVCAVASFSAFNCLMYNAWEQTQYQNHEPAQATQRQVHRPWECSHLAVGATRLVDCTLQMQQRKDLRGHVHNRVEADYL
jgi:hypothetical protein